MSSMPPDPMNKRYSETYPDQMNHLNSQMNMMTVTQHGYNKFWVSNIKKECLNSFTFYQ